MAGRRPCRSAAGLLGQIQATCIEGSQSAGAYCQRGARPGCTPPISPTSGLRTSDGTEARRLQRRTGGQAELQATHRGSTEGGPVTSLAARLEGAAGVMDQRRSRQSPESMHCWTGTTCRASSPACSSWSEELDVGRSLLDWVEGGRDHGEPGWTGSRPRCTVAGVLT